MDGEEAGGAAVATMVSAKTVLEDRSSLPAIAPTPEDGAVSTTQTASLAGDNGQNKHNSHQVTATTAVDVRAADTNGRTMQELRMHQEAPSQRNGQHVAFQQQQQVQRGLPGTGQQWDDVVRRMNSPAGGNNGSRSNVSSTHSLDVSSVDLSSPRSSSVKHEFEPLLLASNQSSSGPWSTSDGGSGLLSPMAAPQTGAPLRGGWSFDTTPIGDGEFSSGNIMDLADVDNLFRSGDGNSVGNGGPSRQHSGISGTSADAGAGGRSQESSSARWMSETMPMDKVVVEPSRKVWVMSRLSTLALCFQEYGLNNFGMFPNGGVHVDLVSRNYNRKQWARASFKQNDPNFRFATTKRNILDGKTQR